MVIEYFEINPNQIRAVWWRKPKIKKLIEIKEIIIKKGIKNTIGIDEKIIKKIIKLYYDYGYNNSINNEKKQDLSKLSSILELPVVLINVILTKKNIIK